jgi:Tfp pilus assembly protein PilO
MADIRAVITGYWQKLAKRERIIVVITTIAVLSALIFQFPYTRMVRSAVALNMKIVTTEKDILDLKTQILELQRWAAGGAGRPTAWQLADQKSSVLFLDDLSVEARGLGLGLVGVHPTQEIDKEKYKEVSMNLDLKGRYRELGEYFKRLEGLQRLVNVRKIRIESCPDAASVCAAQVEVVTYMAK